MDKKRFCADKLLSLLKLFPCVAILGPRQCGKSTLVKSIGREWKYYDLESPDDYQLISSDPLRFFELNPQKVIIDEAQQYPELFKTLRGVIDRDRKKRGRFILTGSSSPHIVQGLTESLAGRIATIELAPFKASEFYEAPLPRFYEILFKKNLKAKDFLALKSPLSNKNMLEFWFKGGFPEPLIESKKNASFHKIWMDNYISNYVERDIRSLFPRLNIHTFKRFLSLLAQFSGHQINMSDIARALEISAPVIKDYLDIVHHTFFWRNLPSFEKNVLKKIQKSKKGFFRDSGILHHYLKIQNLDSLLVHPVAGTSFESFGIEEISRGIAATTSTQVDMYYYRTVDRSEVDLIVDGPTGPIPIEFKLGSKAHLKSIKGLTNIMDDMKLNFGILVNNARKLELLTDRIVQIPIHFL